MRTQEKLFFFDPERHLALKVVFTESELGFSADGFDWESVGEDLDWSAAEWEKEPLLWVHLRRVRPGRVWVELLPTPIHPLKFRALGRVLNEIHDELVRFAGT